MGTWNGLDRYDGYNFKNYKVSADGKDPLTSYRMVDIVENSRGDIWCLTYDERAFIFDTKELKEQLEGVPVDEPYVLQFVKEMIQENITSIVGGVVL